MIARVMIILIIISKLIVIFVKLLLLATSLANCVVIFPSKDGAKAIEILKAKIIMIAIANCHL